MHTRWALWMCLVVSAGCQPIEVGFDYDRSTDFTHYKTYDWAPVNGDAEDPRIDNDLLRRRLHSAVDTELSGLGFVRNAEQPDLLVGWNAAVERRVEVIEMGNRYGYGRGGWYDGATSTRSWEEGTLIVDFVDAARGELVWRGTARGEVDVFAKPEEKEQRMQEVIQKLLANFPPNR